MIDRMQHDFTQGTGVYDIILDTVGTTSFAKCRRMLRGTTRPVSGRADGADRVLANAVDAARRRATVAAGIVTESRTTLGYLMKLAEDGHLKPVIDSTYSLDQIVEAHRHSGFWPQGRECGREGDAGLKCGNECVGRHEHGIRWTSWLALRWHLNMLRDSPRPGGRLGVPHV